MELSPPGLSGSASGRVPVCPAGGRPLTSRWVRVTCYNPRLPVTPVKELPVLLVLGVWPVPPG
jgi:hypothetical protein